MVILAEGTIHQHVPRAEQVAAGAWLGPMIEAGVLHAGYHEEGIRRVLMTINAESKGDVDRRPLDLPVVRNGSVSFRTSRLTALRFHNHLDGSDRDADMPGAQGGEGPVVVRDLGATRKKECNPNPCLAPRFEAVVIAEVVPKWAPWRRT